MSISSMIKIVMLSIALVTFIGTSDTTLGRLVSSSPIVSSGAIGAALLQVSDWLRTNGFLA